MIIRRNNEERVAAYLPQKDSRAVQVEFRYYKLPAIGLQAQLRSPIVSVDIRLSH
jgi:hypothetical protein